MRACLDAAQIELDVPATPIQHTELALGTARASRSVVTSTRPPIRTRAASAARQRAIARAAQPRRDMRRLAPLHHVIAYPEARPRRKSVCREPCCCSTTSTPRRPVRRSASSWRTGRRPAAHRREPARRAACATDPVAVSGAQWAPLAGRAPRRWPDRSAHTGAAAGKPTPGAGWRLREGRLVVRRIGHRDPRAVEQLHGSPRQRHWRLGTRTEQPSALQAEPYHRQRQALAARQ